MKQKTAQILSIALFAALFLWGGYALLAYIGMPIHGLVLFSDAAQADIGAACGEGEEAGTLLCRGLRGFFPFVEFTIARLAPLLWYAAVSLAIFALLIGWKGVQTGQFRLRLRARPWHLPALFIVSLWLLFTVLSLGKTDGISALQIVEPSPLVYQDVSEVSLTALRKNFSALQARGCLAPLGETQGGVKVFRLQGSCVQRAFFTRVLPPLLFLLVFLFELLVLGRFLLRLLRVQPRSQLGETVLSWGLGAGGGIALLWLLAVLGLFQASMGWALAVLLPVVLLPHTRSWLHRIFRTSHEIDVSWRSASVLLFWLLLSYLAFNYLSVVRPFPIGWDDLGSYLNRPRLLVSYGHFIPSMATFQWEYLTALGFLLFGYDSVFGATASMMVNWSAGALAVFTVILFTRTFLQSEGETQRQVGAGLLAALFYYSLPLVGHFSFADMKIDNGVFALGALALYAVFTGLFAPAAEAGGEHASLRGWRRSLPLRWEWFLLGGVFAGLAIGFKVTAVMVFLAAMAVVLGAAHWAGFAGGVFLGFVMLTMNGGFDLVATAERLGLGAVPRSAALTVLLVLALAFFAYAFVRRARPMSSAILMLLLFGAGIAASVLPWMEYNNLTRGRIIPRLAFGAENTLSPIIDFRNPSPAPTADSRVRTLPPDLRLDPQHPACVNTGGTEELGRYWGFREGWGHYVTLPWRTVMNIDAVGYYVTTVPALLLFPLLLLLPYFWTQRGRWLRWLFLGTAMILLQWIFIASGILWYGIGMFLGLAVAMEVLVTRAPDMINRGLMSFLIVASLFIAFSMRMWQFEQQRNLLEYSFGKVSAETLEIRTIPYYDQIRSIVVQRHERMPDRPYLYRVGTFITYFIPKNLEVIGMTDHQLDQFKCLYQERDPALTLKRLKALGFNSIVFDTNTATIEKDPQGTLHRKVQDFVDFLNNPALGLQVVFSDPSHGVAFILIP